jgi:hypothetical protein
MAVQQELGNERTRVFVEGLDVVFERVFDAPLDLVWKVYTDPERIARWWGTHGSTTEVVEMDLRPGGRGTTSATPGSRARSASSGSTSRSIRPTSSGGRSASRAPSSRPATRR